MSLVLRTQFIRQKGAKSKKDGNLIVKCVVRMLWKWADSKFSLDSPWYKVGEHILTGVKRHDMNCGFKVYRAEVVKALQLYGDLHRCIRILV